MFTIYTAGDFVIAPDRSSMKYKVVTNIPNNLTPVSLQHLKCFQCSIL